MLYLLLCPVNNGCTNAPQCHIIRTLSVSFTSFAVHVRVWLQSFSTYLPSTHSFHFLPSYFCVAFCLTACFNAKYLYTALVFCYIMQCLQSLKPYGVGDRVNDELESSFGLVEVHFPVV